MRLDDHAAIADQQDLIEVEALLQLLDLSGERHRITGIAREHIDRRGTTVRGQSRP
jgi:hypothetical protein